MGAVEASGTRAAPWPATTAGLLLALIAPPVLAAIVTPLVIAPRAPGIAGSVIGLAVMWLLAAGVVLLVVHGERRPLRSIGWIGLRRVHALQAVVVGVGLSLAVPVLTVAIGTVLPSGDAGSIASTTRLPWALLLVSVITAAVTEEVLFRGYALERLAELLGGRGAASAFSVASFTIVHAAGWNAAHVVGVVLPLAVALTALYWWRRSLPFVMIVHLLIDLPLVVMSAV